MALSDVKVRSAKPEAKAYKLTDGEGMVLLVHPNGSKYWRLRYRFGGKEKMLALGKYPEVSLADARGRRDEARKLIANGVDPSENKKAVKVEQEQEAITFEVVARDWHASNQKWSASHSARVLKSLEDNLFAAIGKRNIAELKTRDLLVPIKAVESSGRLEVAARLQQRTTAIMRFAVQSGLIDYRSCTVAHVSLNAGIHKGEASPGGEGHLFKIRSGKGGYFYLYFNAATGEVELTKVMNY